MPDASRTEYAAAVRGASQPDSRDPRPIRRFAQAAGAGALVMAALGALAFYLVFPTDLLEDYMFPREPPSIWYQIGAVAAASLFMTVIYVVGAPTNKQPRVAAGFGALLGLLASGPTQLALGAIVRSNPWRNIAIICWTTATWGVAGATISWVLNREISNVRGTDATNSVGAKPVKTP